MIILRNGKAYSVGNNLIRQESIGDGPVYVISASRVLGYMPNYTFRISSFQRRTNRQPIE